MSGAGLRIAIDARAAAEERGGRGTLVRELLRALAAEDSPHTYVCLARERWAEPTLDARFTWERIGAGDPLWNLRAARRANAVGDVFVSTNSYLTAWFTRVPSLVVVCDMASWMPEVHPQARAARIERATLPLAVRRAGAFAAISASAADDLALRFPAARERTIVTPLAADARFSAPAADAGADAAVRAAHGLSRPYVLGVGTLEPRKNLPRLIEAFAGLDPAVRGDAQLALVGASGWDTATTDAAIGAHGDLVLRLGFVPDDDLVALYRGATAFAYPSLYEGFGLPVLEAMAAGVPVLTSNVSSLPEVGNGDVVYADPHDVAAIRTGLGALLGDEALRARLALAGPARAATFSWARYAAQIRGACERLATGRPV